VRGAPIAIANHGFEAPVIADGTFNTSAAPGGWSVYGQGIDFGLRTIGVLNPAATTLYIVPAPEGQNVGVILLRRHRHQCGEEILSCGRRALKGGKRQ
jgi:hypothetical protein